MHTGSSRFFNSIYHLLRYFKPVSPKIKFNSFMYLPNHIASYDAKLIFQRSKAVLNSDITLF